MKRIIFALLILIAVIGCAAKPQLVGDTKTHKYFENNQANVDKIPAEQRIFFDDIDAAHQRGFLDYREADHKVED